jgi:hypothetical protein
MRLTAYHDDEGNIAALIAGPDDAPPAQIELRTPMRITEVEAPELTVDLDFEQMQERLSELMSGQRVEFEGGRASLAEKKARRRRRPRP